MFDYQYFVSYCAWLELLSFFFASDSFFSCFREVYPIKFDKMLLP